MNPAAPIMITVAMVIPLMFLAMYFQRYIHLARRPDQARLKVLRWALATILTLAAGFFIFQAVCQWKQFHLTTPRADWLIWLLLLAAATLIWWQIRRLQKRVKKR